MKRTEQAFIGHWRITEMETWDADYFDMDMPAHITIRKDLKGEFQFGMVQGGSMGGWRTTMARCALNFPGRGLTRTTP